MAKSYKFGLLGQNISYSKSADIFKAIFELKNIEGTFENFELSGSNFEEKFKHIIENGIDGFSVTIPFKNKVLPLLNEVSTVAKALDAVNSIAVTNGILYGYNTDITGFSMPLENHAAQLKNGSALILGAGGSAHAVVYALHTDYEISHFTILGRNKDRLSLFEQKMKKILLNTDIHTISFEDFRSESDNPFTIVVNCTPLGGWNHPNESPLPTGFEINSTKIYYDLNYNKDNKVTELAVQADITTFDGSRMLVGQALRSFEIWTGQSADFNQIYERVFGERKQQSSKTGSP